jgi:hypothetical protein
MISLLMGGDQSSTVILDVVAALVPTGVEISRNLNPFRRRAPRTRGIQ